MATQKNQSIRNILHSLTSVARRRLVKAHVNFEQFVAPLLDVYKSHVQQLRILGLDPNAVMAALRQYQALADDEAAASAKLESIRDARLQLSSHVWTVMLEIYARAQAFSRLDPTIKSAIADFAVFMKHGPRKKAAASTQPA